jgi:hypothetical protein
MMRTVPKEDLLKGEAKWKAKNTNKLANAKTLAERWRRGDDWYCSMEVSSCLQCSSDNS